MISFSPQGKVIVPIWKLPVSAWNVPWIFFPCAPLFARIQVMCQPVTSSTDGLISSEQRSKQLVLVWTPVCVRGVTSYPRKLTLLTTHSSVTPVLTSCCAKIQKILHQFIRQTLADVPPCVKIKSASLFEEIWERENTRHATRPMKGN